MANSPTNIRFTEDMYANRNEVSRILGTNLIDPIWNDIIRYRKEIQKPINVFDITHQPLLVSYTSKINEKISAINALNSKLAELFNNVYAGESSLGIIKDSQILIILRDIAKQNNLNFSENILKDVIAKNRTPESCEILVKYQQALENLSKDFSGEIDEEFLAKFLAIFRGESELTSFYRLTEIKVASQMYLISREYAAAPVHEIEYLMNSLFAYLKSDADLATKIAVVIYMFEFIKPFDDYNREMSFIVAKKLIADSVLGSNAAYIPLENILLEQNFYEFTTKEIQKTRDLTYGLVIVFDILEKAYTSLSDKIVQINGHDVRQTYYAGESRAKFEQEFNAKPDDGVVIETKNEQIIKTDANQVGEANKAQFSSSSLEELSEKELKKLANDMLESNPMIKKAQAHFYVRHCSKGKYYTIQEFKKCERVVYETARTSMDNLAEQGYYKKEQIKNKFVYTPITK